MALQDKVFKLEVENYPAPKRYLAKFAQFMLGFFGEFNKDNCVVRAQGMAYTSLLALVPLFVMMFAMFSAFPAFDDVKLKVQKTIVAGFIPERSEEIMTYIDQFTANVSKLGLIGLIAFLFTAVMLLDNIEKNFNNIFQVTKKRKFVNKMTAYTTLLVFGTFLLGASFSITARIKSLMQFEGALIGAFNQFALNLFPMLLTFLTFLLMYKVIPNTTVKFKSAAVGALVCSLLWELAKNWFWNAGGTMVKNSAIYGSMALVPTFLVWLYLTWIIVLIGLEISYTHQNFKALVQNRIFNKLSGRDRLGLTLRFFSYLALNFLEGKKPPTLPEMSDRFDVPLEVADEYLENLVQKSLVHQVGTGDEGFVPARSLDKITVKDVVSAFFIDEEATADESENLDKAVEKTLDKFHDGAYGALGEMTYLDYLKGMGG